MLFDATGTLIELVEPVGDTYARVAAAHGVRLPAWRIGDAFRRILAQQAPRVFPGAPTRDVPAHERAWWRSVVRATFRAADQTVAFDDFDGLFDELFEVYATARTWRLRPGVRPTLAALAAGDLRLGVVSDFDHRLSRILECLEIRSFFEVVILTGELGAAKPDPRGFEAALAALGVPGTGAIYVGDDPERDRPGAARAGMAFLDVRELSDFAELPARLAKV